MEQSIVEGKGLSNKLQLKKVLTLMAWVSVIGLLVFSLTRANEIEENQFEQFKVFNQHVKISDSPLVYEVTLDGVDVGYLAFGSEYGYQSEIMMGVVVDMSGEVLEALMIEENETPSFIVKINNAGFLERQFPGKAIEEGFDINTNVQAVTGATVSSKAITKAVAEASQVLGKNYLDIQVPSNRDVDFGITEVVLLGMLVLALLSYKLKNKALRYLTMAYSVILLGFMYKQFIAYSWIVSLVTGKVPALADNMGWYILMVGTLLFIALTGTNVYCAYICPFGALQQAENRLAGFGFFKVNPMLKKKLRAVPPILAYVGFVAAILSDQMGALSFEPFSLIYGRTGVGIQWALLPIVLIMALFVMGFYCQHACPVGFVLRQGVRLRRRIAEMTGYKKGVDKEVIAGKVAKVKKEKRAQNISLKIADMVMLLAVLATAGISLMTILGNI